MAHALRAAAAVPGQLRHNSGFFRTGGPFLPGIMRYEWLVGLRYTRSRKRAQGRNRFISFISLVSMLGIALGVAALITVLSVMNGFQEELRSRILGVASHVQISGYDGALDSWQQVAEAALKNADVVASAPFVEERFNSEPNGPGLSNSYDATMVALLAMEAAGKDAKGADIAAAVARVTDPAGTPVTADAAGFAAARDVLAGGGSVLYQGATGNVRFDANGDVSAPAVIWSFTESGTKEDSYITLEEVDALTGAGN